MRYSPGKVRTDGTILVSIPVGSKMTCPPGNACVGKAWSLGFCAVFGKRLEKTRDRSGKQLQSRDGKYLYSKCPECLAARRRADDELAALFDL